MHKNIETVAGCLTRLTCEVITADGATPPELTAYVLIEQQSYPAGQEPDGVLLFPAVDYGQHLYEVRANGKPVLFGHLLVRPSAFPQDSGVIDYALAIDASQVDGAKITLTLTPGPRGPKGATGASAYDIAVSYGYAGTQEEWVAELQGAAAAANAAKVSAAEAQRHELLAEEFKYEAAVAKASAEDSAAEAAESAAQAAERAADAASCSAAAARGASTAEGAASSAAARAEAAATSASVAQEASAATQEASSAAARSASVAQEAKAAAQEAAEAAAQEAALLEDAALCSGNNVFFGGNVFNGPLSLNGPLEVTGAFSWGGFPVGWQEDFWLASHGTNPKSKECKKVSEWMELNPDWARRRRLLIYIPALDYDDSNGKLYDNIIPAGNGVCEECVYVGKCISYEEYSNPGACWQAFGSKRWFVFSTTNVFRGFGGLRTVEEFTAFLPWVTTVSAAGVLDNLGKDAAGCILRLYAPICTNVYTLFKRCFWTELVLDMPRLDCDFAVGYQAATSSHAVPVVKLAQIVQQLPVRDGADVRTVTAYVPAAEVAADAAVFDELVAEAAGKNWSLVYVLV